MRKFKMSIEWVPLINVPMQRRLELLAAASQMFFLLFGQLMCLSAFGCCLVTKNKYKNKIGFLFNIILVIYRIVFVLIDFRFMVI